MNTQKTIKRTSLGILPITNRAHLFVKTKLFRVAPINFRQIDFVIKVIHLYACFKERLLIKLLSQGCCVNRAGFSKDIHFWGKGRCQYCLPSACGVN